jgi:hypothetical protein
VKRPPEAVLRWIWRAALGAALLSAAGQAVTPEPTPPLMCKIYG